MRLGRSERGSGGPSLTRSPGKITDEANRHLAPSKEVMAGSWESKKPSSSTPFMRQ